jgi:pyruvate/2-oxoglutarate dehydrogenase complex dihydrolipoamide acyltransferase (E2) component
LTAIPGLQLSFETESLTFAKSGELAVEVGTYKMVMGEGATQATDTGKTTVTWIRKDGKWQVLTDMFSSDAAAPAAPAAAPAATDPAAVPAEGAAPAAEGAAAPAAPATPPAN